MSTGLKPLLLPQKVEEERRLQQQQQQQLQQQQQAPAVTPSDADHTLLYYTHSSSSSDLASPSPVTPTFSRTHLRYSGSTSSLASVSSDAPVSPVPPVHVAANKNSKSQLPDVQEDPLEREDEEDPTIIPQRFDNAGLYSCLCDQPCSHHEDLIHSPTICPYTLADVEFDYDLGFLSDADFNSSPRQKKRRHGSDAGFSTWGSKLGSRLPSLPRWRSSARRSHLTFSPASDPSLDQRPVYSRATSSRSSSVSAPARGPLDRHEPPLPVTPALSFYESVESLPLPLDASPAAAGKTIERDRAMATTPLLPPLMTAGPPPRSLQPSPLQSPTVAPSPAGELPAHQTYPTPPLSTKASVSSFRRGTVSSTHSEIASPVPCILDHQDAWSDRLGHANFTIEPRPYAPEKADLAALQTFRQDWSTARLNYTRHLVRTGEHYGTTSPTYSLTQAKWAEIEQEWLRTEDRLIQRLDPHVCGDALASSQLRRAAEEVMPDAIPRMLSDDAKFPERGDVDIVGPMHREAFMVREGHEDRRHSASSWFKNLAEKVKLRK